MNGGDVLGALRATPRFAGIPVIVVSGDHLTVERVHAAAGIGQASQLTPCVRWTGVRNDIFISALPFSSTRGTRSAGRPLYARSFGTAAPRAIVS